MAPMERRQSLAQLASIPDTEEWLVTATGRYIRRLDDTILTLFFLAMPVSSRPP